MPELTLRDTVAGFMCLFSLKHFGDDDDPDIRLAISLPELAVTAPTTLVPEVWLARMGLEDHDDLTLTSTRLRLTLGDRMDDEGSMIGDMDRLQLGRLMAVPENDARALLIQLTEQRAVSQIAETVRVYRELELEALYGTQCYRLQFIEHAMRLLEHARNEAEARLVDNRYDTRPRRNSVP